MLLALTGLVVALLPILPGWLFLLLSLVVLSADIPILRRAVCWIEKRFPITQKPLERLKKTFYGKDTPPSPCEPEKEAQGDSAGDGKKPRSP